MALSRAASSPHLRDRSRLTPGLIRPWPSRRWKRLHWFACTFPRRYARPKVAPNRTNLLIDAGLGKSEIRDLSRAFELPTWDKPAMACLASRIPHGTTVTVEALDQVGAAEAALPAFTKASAGPP